MFQIIIWSNRIQKAYHIFECKQEINEKYRHH